jgi:hypothetical protein
MIGAAVAGDADGKRACEWVKVVRKGEAITVAR